MSEQPSFFSKYPVDTFLLPVAVLLGALVISGSILYAGSGGAATIADTNDVGTIVQATAAPKVKDPASLVASDDPILGNTKATVTIVEFSDFQCPFCRTFWKGAYQQIKKEYVDTGKVRFVYRDFPLSFHPAAKPAALAGQCALEQGKFWQYHDLVYAEQDKQGTGTVSFGATELKAWARKVGLNGGQFDSCLDSAKYQKRVEDDTAAGSAAGVSGTPSFFINGELIVGAQPFEKFKTAIEAALR